MKVTEALKIKLTRFKRKYEYEMGNYGIVLEKMSGALCMYLTDASHDEIYGIAPLGAEKDFKDVNLYLYPIDENRVFFRIRRAVMFIDYANKWCSTNVENFRVIGSPDWGKECLVPWKKEYTRLYNEAENKRTGNTGAKSEDE